jgi:hypothetical protein
MAVHVAQQQAIFILKGMIMLLFPFHSFLNNCLKIVTIG